MNEPFANFYGLLNEGNGISAAAVCPNKSPTVVEFKVDKDFLFSTSCAMTGFSMVHESRKSITI